MEEFKNKIIQGDCLEVMKGIPDDWECVGYSEIEPNAIKVYQKH